MVPGPQLFTEWIERMAAAGKGEGLFARWPLLADQLCDWADEVL